jgi:heme oxygenase
MPTLHRPPTAPAFAPQLDRAVAPIEAALDALPVVQSLLSGTITRMAYLKLLQSHFLMHRGIERALASAPHLAGFRHPMFQREEALARDLHLLKGHLPIRESEPLARFAFLVASWIKPPCASLVGTLLVVERRRKKALRAARPLAALLKVKVAERCGLDYLLDGSGHAARRLAQLESWIAEHVRHADRQRELIEGAVKTMETLVEIHREGEPKA